MNAPTMSKVCFEMCLEWFMDHMTWNVKKCNKVIFSDKKAVSMKAFDGFEYYGHKLRKEKKNFSLRQNGEQRIVAWDAIYVIGKKKLENSACQPKIKKGLFYFTDALNSNF